VVRKLIALFAAAAASAAAQEAAPTGSHVASAETVSDVRVIERAQIEQSGYATFGELLQELPDLAVQGNRNVNNGSDGSTALSLHNLGAARTLVLVDGKRWAPFGVSGFSDLNSIPTHLIERIEILESGGSAAYGSGAMGGVVNLITRKRSGETEAQAFGGLTTHGDAEQVDLSLTSGFAFDKAAFFAGAGYLDQEPVGTRGFAATPLAYDFVNQKATPFGSSILPQGTVSLDPSGCTTVTCLDLARAFGPGTQKFIAAGPCTGCVDGFRPATAADRYNFQPANDLVRPLRQVSLFANGEARFSPIARAYAQASFVDRRTSSMLAPDPLATFGPLTVDAANAFNPFGETVQVNRRAVEAGNRVQDWSADVYRAVLGIDGGLPSGLSFDLSFNYGRTHQREEDRGSFGVAQLAQSLGPSFTDLTGTHCGTLLTGAIPGCVPADVLSPPGALTQAMLAGMGLRTAHTTTDAQLASARLDVTQSLGALGPAREATLAFGYEYRAELGRISPDVSFSASPNESFGANPLDGSFHSNELYAELDVPLETNLDLRAGGRGVYDSGFGATGAAFAGARYQPLKGITLRGNYSLNYRAPTIDERFDPTSLGGSLTLGNRNVSAERSRNANLGVVYEPLFARPLLVSLDYWDVAIYDAIGAVRCDGETVGCAPATVFLNGGGTVTSGLDLQGRYSLPLAMGRLGVRAIVSYLVRYEQTFSDGAAISSAGNYDFASSSVFGGLTPRFKANASIDWSASGFDAALFGRFIGGFTECPAAPDATGTFPGRCSFLAGSGSHEVPAYLELDLSLGYTIAKTTLSAGVRNLFDAAPPQVFESFLTFADPQYDFTGRTIYARATQRFRSRGSSRGGVCRLCARPAEEARTALHRRGVRSLFDTVEQRRASAPHAHPADAEARRGDALRDRSEAARPADRSREGEVHRLRSRGGAAQGRVRLVGVRRAVGNADEAQLLAARARQAPDAVRRRDGRRQ
jgi:iron complex outermembrane receptor protein